MKSSSLVSASLCALAFLSGIAQAALAQKDKDLAEAMKACEAAVVFQKNHSEGKLYLSRYAKRSDSFAYKFEAPRAGKYHMIARLIPPAPNQTLDVLINGTENIEMPLPYTAGMWGSTAPLEIELIRCENVMKSPARCG